MFCCVCWYVVVDVVVFVYWGSFCWFVGVVVELFGMVVVVFVDWCVVYCGVYFWGKLD